MLATKKKKVLGCLHTGNKKTQNSGRFYYFMEQQAYWIKDMLAFFNNEEENCAKKICYGCQTDQRMLIKLK